LNRVTVRSSRDHYNLYAIAFNITSFTIILQPDGLMINSLIVKIVAWILTTGDWSMAYANRGQCATSFRQDFELDHRRKECLGTVMNAQAAARVFQCPGSPEYKCPAKFLAGHFFISNRHPPD